MRTAQGAIWRKWDLHIHTPASFHWTGKQLRQMSAIEKTAALETIIAAINNADAAAFAIMDYWTFDGYIALRQFLATKPTGYLTKQIFPGIELRLVSPTSYRLNAHALFSDELTEQQLDDFRSQLTLALTRMPLSHDRLIELGRQLNTDKLVKHGFTAESVQADASKAWLAGCTTAEVDPQSFIDAFKVVPPDKGLVFMPWDTSDGLSALQWAEHYAYARQFFLRPEIFETRDIDQRCAFVGIRTEKNEKYFANFQKALNNRPRLAVCGSDAHSVDRYAIFPGEIATWIKAERGGRGFSDRSVSGNLPVQYSNRRAEIHEETKT